MSLVEAVRGPDVAARLDDLAHVCRFQGKYSEAESLYERALDVRMKTLGPENPSVVTSLNNLVALAEKAAGPEHPSVATALIRMAKFYGARRKYAEAEQPLRRALTIQEKAFGSEHPEVAVLSDLGWLYHAQKRYSEAEVTYQRALAIPKRPWAPPISPNSPTISLAATRTEVIVGPPADQMSVRLSGGLPQASWGERDASPSDVSAPKAFARPKSSTLTLRSGVILMSAGRGRDERCLFVIRLEVVVTSSAPRPMIQSPSTRATGSCRSGFVGLAVEQQRAAALSWAIASCRCSGEWK